VLLSDLTIMVKFETLYGSSCCVWSSKRFPCLAAMQVCIRFNPVAEGAYCLPLFLRIKDGKQLQLQLSAQAVAPSAQLALAVRGSYSCQLTAAPIGELQPPLQQYSLYNAGPAPLQYRLDTTPLQDLAKQNYSAEIIKYAGGSPLSGKTRQCMAATCGRGLASAACL
jgi:hypothetical protein